MNTLCSPCITLAELPAGWVELRRQIAQRDGHALRAGAGNTIEVQSINTGAWHRLTLPNQAAAFAHELERNAVLAALQEAQKPNAKGSGLKQCDVVAPLRPDPLSTHTR